MKNHVLAAEIIALAAAVLAGCETPTGPSAVQDTYVHYRAAWSPDGSTILFIGTVGAVKGIYAVDTSGSNVRLVYTGDTGGPTWSPDSRWLAFSQQLNIFKVKITGDSLTQLTNGGADVRPAWSRDGKTVAFERSGVWLLDVKADTARPLLGGGNYAYYPSWHPNGAEIVVMVPSFTGYSFYAVRTDSAIARALLTLTTSDYFSFPSISPTGREVIFSFTPADYSNHTEIWKADLVTLQSTQLTDDGGDYASWSPDGTKIVYTRTQTGDGGLWVMKADGSGKRRLTTP